MKKTFIKILAYSFLSAGLMTSCNTQFQLMTEGENFDALTKITEHEKPCLSPTGGRNAKNLFFIVEDEAANYNVYKKGEALKKAIIKKTSGSNYNLSPDYNEKTDRVVFQYLDDTNFDIYYINGTKGKAITQITNTDENEYNPSWSENGRQIVFEKGAAPREYYTIRKNLSAAEYKLVEVTKNQIWIKDLETGELKMLGEGSFAKFSPDGTELAFVRYQLNKKENAETGTIWVMSVNGEEPRQITGSSLGYASCPSWSPNGKSLVFHLTKEKKRDADIFTIDSDGENLRQHTTNESNDFSPVWTSDNMIYFSSDRGADKGDYQIWRFEMK